MGRKDNATLRPAQSRRKIAPPIVHGRAGQVNRRFAAFGDAGAGTTGHLFQARFAPPRLRRGRGRACRIWIYAALILRRPSVSEGLEGCSRDRVNALSGASFEAASRRLRMRGGGASDSYRMQRALACAYILPAATTRWPRSARRWSAPRFADLLELSLDEQAAFDGFDRTSPNGRPLGAPDFISEAERKLGRQARPG